MKTLSSLFCLILLFLLSVSTVTVAKSVVSTLPQHNPASAETRDSLQVVVTELDERYFDAYNHCDLDALDELHTDDGWKVSRLISYDHGPPQTSSLETGGAPEQIQDGWRTASPAEVGMDPARLEELTRSLRHGEHGNFHALLIEKDGRLAYEEYFTGEDETWGLSLGTVTFGRTSLHDLRSAAKSVVSTLIGIAIGHGEIPSVEVRLRDLLPEYAALLEGEKAELRLQHVLSMSVGLEWDEHSNPYSHPQNPWQQLNEAADPIAFLLDRELVHKPGSTFTYNTGLTYLLAAILKRATGERVDDYARRVLFEPLGIRDVVWLGRIGGRTPPAAAGLRLRARDFAKIGSLFLNGGRWNGRQIVPEMWVAEAPIRRVLLPSLGSRPDFGLEVGYGYQWWSTRYATSHGEVDVYIMLGMGGQRVMVVPELTLAVTMFAGHYNDPNLEINWLPDRLLVEHIIEAMILQRNGGE